MWKTSEHYFQAKKFEKTIHEEEIRNISSASKAAKEGRKRTLPLRKDWEDVKLDVMRTALYEKFTQNKGIKEILLSTKTATLVEHTTNDNFWGDGGDGSGKNWLGKLLMELREKFFKEEPQQAEK